MNNCLCCDHTLLRHIRHGALYWYCSSCRQDMPNLQVRSLSTALRKLDKSAQLTHTALM